MFRSAEAAVSDVESPPLWLLGVDTEPAAPPDEAAFEAACDFAHEVWQVLPVVWRRLRDWAGPQLMDSAAAGRLRDRLVAVQVMARLQHVLLQRFAAELERRHIPWVLLKGDAARVIAYPHAGDRCGLDLDLGVPAECCFDAVQVALEQGFVLAQWNAETKLFHPADRPERAEPDSGDVELGLLARDQVVTDLTDEQAAAIRRALPGQASWHETPDGELACYVSLDLHYALFLNCPVDGAVGSAVEMTRDGAAFRVPGLPWVILHLIGKIYLEGVAVYRHGGHQFADLLRLVPLLDGRGATRLVRLLEQHQLEIPAFYVLRRLPSEFGIELPDPLAQLVERHRKSPGKGIDAYAANDRGDVWPKLWGYR